ncbi:FtsK/SpoIIIE domain-containing protein [Virgisporangium ochraceum]|uniref:Cell division protein FtsK n=2 Tax=Virgisporangium ochraceum TaxID=65505 RepID=A0A8J3ZQX5_9ACTN|nr:cell division protein FtsK [Virgisporangium ochraceum]
MIALAVSWPLRHPRTTSTAAAGWLAWRASARVGYPGWWGLVALALVPVVVLAGWALIHRSSFRAHGWPRALGWLRRWTVYAPAWPLWMRRCHLTTRDENGRHLVPKLARVRCTPALDRLLVEVPIGATPETFVDAADQIANAARSEECRVRVESPGRVWIEIRRRDLLAKVVPVTPLPPDRLAFVDHGVQLGLRDDGLPWRVPVLDVHRLVAGRSRSGKGSLLWGEIIALAPAVAAGFVELVGIDPKGGMELAIGRDLFTRFVYSDPETMVDAIEAFADEMDARADQLRGVVRKFAVSEATPLKLLVIDELATLTLYAGPMVAARAERAIGRVLTKGAAVGFLVRGYVQDPRKDTVPMRGLFTHRVALGLDTPSEVDMVLGEGAHARGARADQIPLHAKGTAYELEDGNPEPYRVRAGFPTDDDIRAVAAAFPARRRDSLSADRSGAPADAVAPPVRSDNGRRGSGDKTLIPASLLAALADATENER